jgi:hypothetical protein
MLTFEKYLHVFSKYAGVQPQGRMRGPAIACVAWIPYRDEIPHDSGLHLYSQSTLGRGLLSSAAMPLMLKMGNVEPPRRLSSTENFLESLVRNKEFRGAVAIDDVFALIAPNGDFMGIELTYFSAVGYTPFLRLSPGFSGIMCSGYGDSDYHLSAIPDQFVTFEIWQSFKMGHLVEFGQYILTGARAASATLKIDYTFRSHGNVEIDLVGSAVPSQSHYLRWQDRSDHYDMMGAPESEIKGFFEAGACITAPIGDRAALVYPVTTTFER